LESSGSVIYVESNRMSSRKRTVIDILRANPDFVSGEAISGTLGISRNAVHKHINSLRSRGYRILGVSHRGYKLEEEPCRLSIPLVSSMTRHSLFGRAFRYYDEIESTNAEAKALANSGAPLEPGAIDVLNRFVATLTRHSIPPARSVCVRG